MIRAVRLNLKGKAMQLEREGDRTLLEVLLNDLGLTGAELGCRDSQRGARRDRGTLRPAAADCRPGPRRDGHDAGGGLGPRVGPGAASAGHPGRSVRDCRW